MREITKSALSLSWAMSLFGLKQLAGLFTPGSHAAASFATVTRCTEDQLGPATQATFRAGDNLQRGLVDLAFAFLTLGRWLPGSGRSGWGQGEMGPAMAPGATGGCASCGSAGANAASTGSSAAQAAGNLTSQAMGAGIDLVQQGVNVAYQAMGGGSAAQPTNTGWGPVPPPGFQMMG